MEAIAQSAEDHLIDALSFKLRPGASYITNRRSVTYFPQGGNDYSPNGVRVIRLMLTGDSWLDPSTIRLMFDLNNTATTTGGNNPLLRTIGGPWSFFRRLRILCGGQIVEDIDYYNRAHQMFHMLQPEEVRQNDDIEGFRNKLLSTLDVRPIVLPTGMNEIAPGKKMSVGFKFLSGLFNQEKYLPIRYCPITIELELVNTFTDAIIGLNSTSYSANPYDATTTSQTWSINNVQLKCDVVALDNSLDNEYTDHLLSGKALPINFGTFVTQMQMTNSAQNLSVNLSRAFSRLKSIFVNFHIAAGPATANVAGNVLFNPGTRKQWNYFYHPMAWETQYNPDNEVELQIQIGSKLFPEYPIKSNSESFHQLKKCLGIQGSQWHAINISSDQYLRERFVVGIDAEKVLQAGYTGLNTKAGDLMTIKAKFGTALGAQLPDTMFIFLHNDVILNIRDTGVEVFD